MCLIPRFATNTWMQLTLKNNTKCYTRCRQNDQFWKYMFMYSKKQIIQIRPRFSNQIYDTRQKVKGDRILHSYGLRERYIEAKYISLPFTKGIVRELIYQLFWSRTNILFWSKFVFGGNNFQSLKLVRYTSLTQVDQSFMWTLKMCNSFYLTLKKLILPPYK